MVGRAFLRRIKANGWLPQAVGGLTLGADPIAFAIARESLDTDRPIHAFIVRKEAKKHGMGRFIEGLEEMQGCRVVILDDVCTTGDSTALAIEKTKDAGMEVLGAICLVDRESGANELLQNKFGCALDSVFKLSDFQANENEPGRPARVIESAA
ncbi:MAG: orotate phosphoribosyltransferase [Candidatus Solibacter usitatus]|nr:orotate phosphoribosyltransferase [Candidatus Solibacter usitatus]